MKGNFNSIHYTSTYILLRYVTCLSIFFCALTALSIDLVIMPYQQSRDMVAIKKILDDHYHELTYEALGSSQGTTEKYLASKTYVTDVIRLDDQTIGFVNYVAYNRNFCSFHCDRRGLIHLIGIDKEYQGKRYGTMLLEHAMQQLVQMKCSYIDVFVQNTNRKAINLYQRMGFVCSVSLEIQALIPMLLFTYDTGIPFDKTQCNIIQRYPRTCAVMASFALLIYGYKMYRL